MSDFQYTVTLPQGIQSLFIQLEGIDFSTQQIFKEALNLKQLSQRSISNLTAQHLYTRLSDPKANSKVDLLEAKWKIQSNQVIVFFYVEPTYGGKTVLTPSAKPYQGSFYNIVFQFEGVETFLGNIDEFTAKAENEREKAVEEMVWGSPVKLYSNDPSFYYQAGWEDLAKLDGVIFPFPGPTGTGHWHDIHVASGGLTNPNIHLTKHQASIIMRMKKFIPYITKALKRVD